MLVYLNGRYVPKEEATISVFDHGFLYGDGIYETVRAYAGHLFLLDRHLVRLSRSAEGIYLSLPTTPEKLASALKTTLTTNMLRDAYVRIQISRGPGEIGLDPALCSRPTTVIIAKPLSDYPAEYYDQGVSIALVQTRRNHPQALNPIIKGTNFLNNILAKIEAINAGAYEGIMLNWEGFIAEGTTSNIFMVKDGVLLTPSLATGILEGVTRGLVLELAAAARIPIKEAALKPEDLLNADECFITSSTIEIMPATLCGGAKIGTGKPGPVTGVLMDAYRNEVKKCSQIQAS